MNFFSEFSLDSLESFVWQMPGFFMVKDAESRILMTNQIATHLLGFTSIEEIAGTFDKDSKCEDIARISEQLIYEDKLTTASNDRLEILYIVKLIDKQFRALHATKKQIIINNKKLILCSGNFINPTISAQIAGNFEKINALFVQKNTLKTDCYYINRSLQDSVQLPKQQLWCLFYLLRGKSFKEIAKLMKLSARTVESYVESIKYKFNCPSKSALIEKAISLGYAYCLPIEFFNLEK